jgi:hypothetical protein
MSESQTEFDFTYKPEMQIAAYEAVRAKYWKFLILSFPAFCVIAALGIANQFLGSPLVALVMLILFSVFMLKPVKDKWAMKKAAHPFNLCLNFSSQGVAIQGNGGTTVLKKWSDLFNYFPTRYGIIFWFNSKEQWILPDAFWDDKGVIVLLPDEVFENLEARKEFIEFLKSVKWDSKVNWDDWLAGKCKSRG